MTQVQRQCSGPPGRFPWTMDMLAKSCRISAVAHSTKWPYATLACHPHVVAMPAGLPFLSHSIFPHWAGATQTG